MSSLLKEELERVLFRPEGQRLVEFIEIEEPAPGRHFFCVGGRLTHDQVTFLQVICIVLILLHVSGPYSLISLQDDPCFILHFDKVRSVTAINCSAKYALVRALVKLSDKHSKVALNVENMDWAYVRPTSFYSNRGDCAVLSQICFYAFNLVCLSMCPVPLD
uniref:Uncharacterized protein n=1 Tax=Gadus morhua TaxID=8049 RepID=A0A8C5B7D4_GADMO